MAAECPGACHTSSAGSNECSCPGHFLLFVQSQDPSPDTHSLHSGWVFWVIPLQLTNQQTPSQTCPDCISKVVLGSVKLTIPRVRSPVSSFPWPFLVLSLLLSLLHPCFRYGCARVTRCACAIACLCGACTLCERQRSSLGVVLPALLLEARSLTVIWSLSIRLSWLANEPQGCFCLCLLSDKITGTHHRTFFSLIIWSFSLLSLLLHEYWQSD